MLKRMRTTRGKMRRGGRSLTGVKTGSASSREKGPEGRIWREEKGELQGEKNQITGVTRRKNLGVQLKGWGNYKKGRCEWKRHERREIRGKPKRKREDTEPWGPQKCGDNGEGRKGAGGIRGKSLAGFARVKGKRRKGRALGGDNRATRGNDQTGRGKKKRKQTGLEGDGRV